MIAVIEKSRAEGEIYAPSSKSISHRLLICAALAEGESVIRRISLCDDVLATIDCLRAMGAEIELCDDTVTVKGFNPKNIRATEVMNARESGSTLRFMIPLALLSGNEARFTGAKRLFERPLGIYETICADMGIKFIKDGASLTVEGKLLSRDIYVSGNVSSQFITGLLFALPFLEGDRRIHVTTDIESRSYIDLTIYAMREFGIEAAWENERTLLVSGGIYSAKDVTVEGDFSAGAFIDALSVLGGKARALGLNIDSLQGDKIYRDYFTYLLSGAPTLSLANCPDLAPILFSVAAACNGATFTDTKRLKIKESDRAAVMAEELSKFGAKIKVEENIVIIKKTKLHAPSDVLYGHNDHRIVMSLAVLSTIFGGTIEGAEAVKKSYPEFFSDLRALNISVNTYEN